MEQTYHIICDSADIGKYVLLPGDPDRVQIIASYLDNPRFVTKNREFTVYTGTLNGVAVSVASTGIGAPSAAIAMEELIKLGAHTFIRVGTCGCMNDTPSPGDTIIATAAIRRDGTSRQYLPIEFPAVANQEIINALADSCRQLGITSHIGIIESKDSYYGQHEPENSPMAPVLLDKWDMFCKGGAIASEMEASILFILGSVRHARVGCILHVTRNRVREEKFHTDPIRFTDTTKTIQAAVNALRSLIEKDKETVS